MSATQLNKNMNSIGSGKVGSRLINTSVTLLKEATTSEDKCKV